METIWIIGIGYFGLSALEKLSVQEKERHFVLVDPDQENLNRGKGPHRTLEHAEGVDFLVQSLEPENAPDWIIPALPVHLVGEWCLSSLGKEKVSRISLPQEIENLIPHPMRGNNGDMYASHATFRCPDNCEEPADICTVTRKPRKQNLFEILEHINLPGFKSLVVRSHQLGPGLGGYRPQQLFDLLDQVKHAEDNVLISTSCRCHGVITGIRIAHSS